MITGIAHICLGALDLDATIRFWCDGLGMKKKFAFQRGGKVVGYYLDSGRGTFVEMFCQDAAEISGRQPIRHVCLEVDDMDKTVKAIKGCGIKISDKTLGCDGSWQAWMEDPNGVKIELHQYTPESSQKTGKDCILPAK